MKSLRKDKTERFIAPSAEKRERRKSIIKNHTLQLKRLDGLALGYKLRPIENKNLRKMNTAFKERIKEKLVALNRNQMQQFSWRCALRTLPLLGADGHFNYWKKEVRQQHLYAVFYAFDEAVNATRSYYSFSLKDSMGDNYQIEYEEAMDAHEHQLQAEKSAKQVLQSMQDLAEGTAPAVAEAIQAIAAACNAAGAANVKTDYLEKAYTYTIDTVNYTLAAYEKRGFALSAIEKILLNDLESLEEEPEEIAIDELTTIWTNFTAALKKEECSYWTKLITGFFKEGYIKQTDYHSPHYKRIKVDEKLKKQGATMVGAHLKQKPTL